MAQTPIEPHVIIGVDPRLTAAIWRRFSERPHVWPLNPHKTARTIPWNTHFPFLQLAGHFFHNNVDDEAVIEVKTAIHSARRHFGLGEREPLVTVVAGNEWMLRCALETAHGLGHLNAGLIVNGAEAVSGESDRKHSLEEVLIDGVIRRGRLACLLGAVLDRIDGLDLQWLGDVIDDWTPKLTTGSYANVIRDVRMSLRSSNPSQLRERSKLKLSASPRLYVKAGDEDWRALPLRGPNELRCSLTDRLIERFRLAREEGDKGPRFRGVLVNVLDEYHAKHSPADPPLITAEECRTAEAAGLEAILLDWRVGLVYPPVPASEGGNISMPVYAA